MSKKKQGTMVRTEAIRSVFFRSTSETFARAASSAYQRKWWPQIETLVDIGRCRDAAQELSKSATHIRQEIQGSVDSIRHQFEQFIGKQISAGDIFEYPKIKSQPVIQSRIPDRKEENGKKMMMMKKKKDMENTKKLDRLLHTCLPGNTFIPIDRAFATTLFKNVRHFAQSLSPPMWSLFHTVRQVLQLSTAWIVIWLFSLTPEISRLFSTVRVLHFGHILDVRYSSTYTSSTFAF
ncbi:hypothetical protein VTP01DRAFT_4409 [Rhizomucor pusillus]|uniref:uncharacterized protein n=1 Tax=Rhizomucor pusillus TaxID=4840 RepID=UPI003742D47B